MATAKRSGFGEKGEYPSQYEWPEDCRLQCGDRGIVLSKAGNYRTAFFEAFPSDPPTFIRGEGETVELAEKNAWEKFQAVLSCTGHEFERRGYRNGVGFCKHCNLFQSKAFEPAEHCTVCNQPTYWTADKNGKYYCEEHVDQIPAEDRPPYMDLFDALDAMMSQSNAKSNAPEHEKAD